MIMNKIGVNQYEIEYFVSEIYNRCKETGLSADNIDIYLQGFQSNYLREKKEQKIELENQIEDLKQEIQEFNSERSTFQKLRDDALQQQKTTASDITCSRVHIIRRKVVTIMDRSVARAVKYSLNGLGQGVLAAIHH